MKKIIEKINKIRKISLRVGLTIAGTLLAPAIAFAVVQTLNGATGQTQTFVNDNNVTITTNTTANTHTFGWSGLLPISRGGTGTGSFTAGSVLFSNGASIFEDNTFFFFDDSSDELNVGGLVVIGGDVELGLGGAVAFKDQSGADVLNLFTAGDGIFGINANSQQYPSGAAHLDIRNLSDERVFIFPNINGTFGLIENNQVWTGLNKFESTTNTTIYVGSSTKSGCIVMGDSDGSGVTYITANDGVLTASSTQPSICQ